MWLAHQGTVGTPIDCTVHICGEDGEELPQGESGTVFFEGGAAFEYHNDPEKTKSSRHPKGWSTLGDVGYLDEDGFLYLTDRKAYMIISGGVNIYPQEAENVLVTHPKVVDVAVFGVPNDDFGEEVKAVVQPVEMPADDAAAAGAGRRADPVLPLATRRRQVPALDRLPRRTPPPPDRQALQAPAERRVLAGRRPQHLSPACTRISTGTGRSRSPIAAATSEYPENTMPAFEHAVSLGFHVPRDRRPPDGRRRARGVPRHRPAAHVRSSGRDRRHDMGGDLASCASTVVTRSR